VPGVGFGGPANVKVDQLVQQRLQHVARADAGVGGNREAELAGNREAEPIRTGARPAHLELGPVLRQRPVSEDRQPPQAVHLLVEGDAGNEVVGPRPRSRRSSRLTPRLALRRRSPAEAPQTWHRGHQ
jgi:hypothetical protein